MLDAFKSFDAYPKTLDDFKERWVVGAIISVISTIVIATIVIGEVSMLGHIERRHQILVDTDVTGELAIHLNITFDKIPCAVLNIDALDGFGESMAHIERSIVKTRLSTGGDEIHSKLEVIDEHGHDQDHSKDAAMAKKTADPKYCGSCFGAEEREGQCCNTCLDVKLAYDKKHWPFTLFDTIEQCARQRLEKKMASTSHEGCRVEGHVLVTKTTGQIHIAPGRSLLRQRLFTLEELFGAKKDTPNFDISHVVNKLSFGQEFPGLVNPLDARIHTGGDNGLYQYHINVVPTRFESLHGTVVETNQYAVTEHVNKKLSPDMGPGLYFRYDLSPVKVHIRETYPHKSLLHFLTSLCAAVGGVFTVAGLVDSMLFHGHQRLAGKFD